MLDWTFCFLYIEAYLRLKLESWHAVLSYKASSCLSFPLHCEHPIVLTSPCQISFNLNSVFEVASDYLKCSFSPLLRTVAYLCCSLKFFFTQCLINGLKADCLPKHNLIYFIVHLCSTLPLLLCKLIKLLKPNKGGLKRITPAEMTGPY